MATNSVLSTGKIKWTYKVAVLFIRFCLRSIGIERVVSERKGLKTPRKRIFWKTLSKYVSIVSCFWKRYLPLMFGRQEWSKTDHFKQSKLAFRPQLSDRRWTFPGISLSFWTNPHRDRHRVAFSIVLMLHVRKTKDYHFENTVHEKSKNLLDSELFVFTIENKYVWIGPKSEWERNFGITSLGILISWFI